MKRCYLRCLSVAALACIFAAPSFAQRFEVYPYAGGSFFGDFRAHPDQIDKFDVVSPGLFGVRGGFMATDRLQIEGNFGSLNQFKFRHPLNPDIDGIQYEGVVNYNFNRMGKIFPYVSGGLGAMSLSVVNPDGLVDADTFTYTVPVPPYEIPITYNLSALKADGPVPASTFIISNTRLFTIENGDTFFTISYGGGIKGERLWGPLGFRVDLRGRTMPNFYGENLSTFEPTAGVLFSWGER
jgi:hypothetical protein